MSVDNKRFEQLVRKFVEQADHCMLNKPHCKEKYRSFQIGFSEALNLLNKHNVKHAKHIQSFLSSVEKLHSDNPIGLNVPLLMLRIETKLVQKSELSVITKAC